jgi:mTERF domain-containing protein, mitochondrial
MFSSLLARRDSSIITSPQCHRLALLTPLLRVSLSTQPQPQKELSFIAEYLISSFGILPDRARKICTTRLSGVKSSDRPEAVVRFLKDIGLSGGQIRGAISRWPDILRYNVEKSLKPTVLEMTAQGFSNEILAQLAEYEPSALALAKTPSRLLFWREFTGNDNAGLLRFLKKNPYLITFDIDGKIMPRMNLLKECGLSNQHIAVMLHGGNTCMRRSLKVLRQVIEIVENMGIQRGSGMFFAGFRAIVNSSLDTVKRKKEFFKTAYGWSEQETCTAFCKFPSILQYSENKVQSAMDFLIREVKLHPSGIALMPNLLGYSLEKRLIPRHRVLSILVAKKLKEKCSLLTACTYSEKIFLQIYVKRYEKDAPELSDVYFTALGGKIAT